jgi:sialic acid synthase
MPSTTIIYIFVVTYYVVAGIEGTKIRNPNSQLSFGISTFYACHHYNIIVAKKFMFPILKIDNYVINEVANCYVVAEIGHNHQGDLQTAKKLFYSALKAGANAVKLQKRDNHTLYIPAMWHKPYSNMNSFGVNYGQHREALEFGREEYQELQAYAKEIDITLFATAFDFASADFLAELEFPAFKIASGDLTNIPLLRHIAEFQKPIIISTGGETLKDVQRAYDTVMPINNQLCIMQCTSSYPCINAEMNLSVISTYRKAWDDIIIGFSDHSDNTITALIGYALGARIIEKHFTLDRTMKGTDQAFSLEYDELHKLVCDLQRVRVMLGKGIKQCYPSEVGSLEKMAKKLVAARNIPEKHILTRDDIAIKSPNDGLPPYELDHLLGKITKRSLKENDNISYTDLANP